MRLLALTPAEIAFLGVSPGVADDLQGRLTRRLSTTLRARLRMTIAALVCPAEVSPIAPTVPVWQPDAALASLWLMRRVGALPGMATVRFVSPGLLRTLDAVLAESWLDAPAQVIPPALAWQFSGAPAPAILSVQLPQSAADMTRWAWEKIRER
jgi:hypothetical protein